MLRAALLIPILIVAAVAAFGMLLAQLFRERKQYALDLEEQVRLLAEEQERLKRAQAEILALTRESQAKSEMLSTLSRETRSHLNGIIASADMLSEGADPIEHLATLQTAAESLHRALNDMLEFADLETGRVAIESEPFDLREPLAGIIERFVPVAARNGVELVLVIAPDVPVVVIGDAFRLRQVVLNLVANAVKFTESGRIVVHVDLPEGSGSVSPQGATWLHFTISDTGLGIPDEMREGFFDQGTPLDKQSPRQFAGAGLGLAVSHRIVALMGGRIGVHASPEGGAEFWVVLPLPAGREQPESPPLVGKYAVVLDDVAATRVAASGLLSRVGLEHDGTDSIAKAIDYLRDAREEGATELALLLDEGVARKQGAALAQSLMREATLAGVRVILLARDPDAPELDSLPLPIVAALRKPLLKPGAVLDVTSGASRSRDSRSPFAAVRNNGKPAPRVLVVDDDEISRTVSSRLLTRLGCQVEIAAGGPAAIARTRDARFDLIFMDCQMPGMDGFATTEVIKGESTSAITPVVALTANATADDRDRCFAAGMCDFIGKPVTRLELARVLKRWA